MILTKTWDAIHFILNEQGHVIGDFEQGSGAYGFLRDRKPFTMDEATADERTMLVNLVFLFFTLGDTQYHNGYEYVELEGYTMYRKVGRVTQYTDLFFRPKPLPKGTYAYVTAAVGDDEFYVLTANDAGFAQAVVNHFKKDHGIELDIAMIEAVNEAEVAYWERSLTVLQPV